MTKTDRAAQTPTDVSGAELILVGPAVQFAKYVYDAVKEGRPTVSPSKPLVFRVADSVTHASGHTLLLDCVNLGGHGVYIDSVAASEPKDAAVTSAQKKPSGLSSLDTGAPISAAPLPLLVASGNAVTLVVTISSFSGDRAKKKPFGTLEVAYTVLGVAKSGLKQDIDFSIHNHK